MTTIETSDRAKPARWGWGILLFASALLVLNSLFLYIFDDSSREIQSTAIILGGLGMLALVVALEGFRHGTRWAWNASWVLVATLAAIAVHVGVTGETVVSIWYLSMAAVTLAAQLLAARGLAK